MDSQQALPSLQLSLRVWNRSTNNLFDYDQIEYPTTTFQVSQPVIVWRKDDQYTLTHQSRDLPSHIPIFKITKDQSSYWIHQMPQTSEQSPIIWYNIRYNRPSLKQITTGDSVKLGRILLKVGHIVENQVYFNLNVGQEADTSFTRLFSSEITCKICLREYQTEKDPLISPCTCDGSMKYCHIQCLKEWLRNKTIASGNFRTLSYRWSDLSCQICKSQLPVKVVIQGVRYDLLSYDNFKKPYMVIQEYSVLGDQIEAVHLVHLAGGSPVTIGRSNHSNLRIPDVSVSRRHARIHYKKGKLFLEDTQSKFGTLIRLGSEIEIEKSLVFQVARTLISVKEVRPFVCCCKKNVGRIRELDVTHHTQEDNNEILNGKSKMVSGRLEVSGLNSPSYYEVDRYAFNSARGVMNED